MFGWMNSKIGNVPHFLSRRYRLSFSHHLSLQTLAGRELSSRRNLLHQLERQFRLESKEIKDQEVKHAV